MLSSAFCIRYLFLVITFVEFIYASARIHVLLLARVERMALTANVNLYHVALFGRAGHKGCAASALHCNFVIIGMYILFHSAYFSLNYLSLSILSLRKPYVKCFFNTKLRLALIMDKYS